MDKCDFEYFINKSLFMKTGVKYCLLNGTKTSILGSVKNPYGAPLKDGETVYIPTEALDVYCGKKQIQNDDIKFFKDENTGKEYKTIDISKVKEIYGVNILCENMGLIIVSTSEIIFNYKGDSGGKMNIMKRFIFDYPSPCEVYEDAKAHTNNFKHPYIFGTEEKFNELKAVYNSNEGDENYNKNLKSYIKRIVDIGINYYKSNALSIETDGKPNFDKYYGIKPECVPVNKNKTPDGCDFGGRLSIPSEIPKYAAFAYRMTGEIKYAQFAYDYQLAIGQWQHWCPGHFLNCAVPTKDCALMLDWLYDVIVELGKTDKHYDVHKIEEICYTHGVMMGYLASFEGQCPFPSLKVGNGGFVYHKKANNWNAVCTSGMTLASFVLMGNDKYKLEASSLVSDGIYYLANYGLGQYAPDGSYIESPTYWSYGTNNLFLQIAALLNATGKDYGYLDTWGLDKTCYFAVNTESSDYKIWCYHDGGTRPSACDTSWFPFVAEVTGNHGLMKIREEQLKGGKSPSLSELFYYKEYADLKETLPLSYFMEGIDTFTARSSWNRGSIFTGIHGASNIVPHGDIDCGQFIYYNKGKCFFTDMGSEQYNVYGYWPNATRFRYYRKSSEGANVIMLTSEKEKMPLGQEMNGTGNIIRTEDSESKTIAVLDYVSAFGEYAENAKRGLLMKDEREVVIVQDEIEFKKAESGYWFGHIDRKDVQTVKISGDGRTAFLTAKISDDESATLRASIISDDKELKFEQMDCYSFVLDGTFPKGESERLGGAAEYERDTYSKLAIKFCDKKNINLAVVLDLVTNENTDNVPYTWNEIKNW